MHAQIPDSGTARRKVLSGMESMTQMQQVETHKEGIFVMPKERITILSSFVYFVADPQDTVGTAWSLEDCGAAQPDQNVSEMYAYSSSGMRHAIASAHLQACTDWQCASCIARNFCIEVYTGCQLR